jgi:uncharacterized membrane protein YtjA (UPF0391 family)
MTKSGYRRNHPETEGSPVCLKNGQSTKICNAATKFQIWKSRPGQSKLAKSKRRSQMLRWALGFFIVALFAAVLGFTGIAVAAAGIAKILFYLFLILFLVTMVGHLLRRT